MTPREHRRLVNHMAVQLVLENYRPEYIPLMDARGWVQARRIRRRQCEAMLRAIDSFGVGLRRKPVRQ